MPTDLIKLDGGGGICGGTCSGGCNGDIGRRLNDDVDGGGCGSTMCNENGGAIVFIVNGIIRFVVLVLGMVVAVGMYNDRRKVDDRW